MFLAGVGDVDTGATTVNPTLPAGLLADDVMFLHVIQTGGSSAVTTPTGWTLIKRRRRSATFVAHVYYRVFAAGMTDPAVTAASADTLAAVVSAYAGADPALANPSTYSTFDSLDDLDTTVTLQASGTPMAADRLVAFVGVQSTVIGDGVDRSEGGQYLAYGEFPLTQLWSSWCDLPLNSNRTLTANLDPNNTGPVEYIAIVITVPPVDRSVTPALGSQREAFRQPPLLGSGSPVAPGADGAPRLVVQVLNPAPTDAAIWDVTSWDEPTWAGPGRWYEINARVRGIDWSRGTQDPLGKPSVGTAHVTLDNLDGQASAWATEGEFVDDISATTPPDDEYPVYGAGFYGAGYYGE